MDVQIDSTTPQQLNDVYTGWANSQINSPTLTIAKNEVVKQLGPLLDAVAGVDSTTVDLIKTPFNANFTGLDIVLEVVTINYNGNIATVTNKLTGSQFTNDLTKSDDNSNGFSGSDSAATTTALNDQEAINILFDKLEALFATRYPNNDELNTFAPYMDDNYLENGVDKTNELDGLLTVGNGPSLVGVKFTAVIDSAMVVPGYEKGYWIQLHIILPGFTSVSFSSVVFDGSNWLMYGNRQWIDAHPYWWAEMWSESSGNVTFRTGLYISKDSITDKFNYAYDRGVMSGIITGPGLPAAGLKIAHKYPANHFELITGDPDIHWMVDDNAILAIPDNSLYTINLYAETADVVTLDYTPLTTTTVVLMKRPYTKAELSSVLFPTLTSPGSHAITELTTKIPGSLDVTWQNSAIEDVSYIVLGWVDNNMDWNELGSTINSGMTSYTFDSTGFPTPVGFGLLALFSIDQYGRALVNRWDFEP